MAGEIREKSELESGGQETVPPSDKKDHSANQVITTILVICATGLLISFFLPWVNILFVQPTGLDLAKEGGGGIFLWSIPFFSGFAILSGITKNSQRTICQIAGIVPIFVLGFGLYHEGTNLLQVLGFGAYLGLTTAVGLITLPYGLK